jgi:hypothetical protein
MAIIPLNPKGNRDLKISSLSAQDKRVKPYPAMAGLLPSYIESGRGRLNAIFSESRRLPFGKQPKGNLMKKIVPTNDRIGIDESYDVIKSLQKNLTKIQELISGADIDTIKLVANIKLLLQSKSQQDISSFFRYDASDQLKEQIGYAQAYHSTFSVDKLKKLIKQLTDARDSQNKYSQETLIANSQRLESLILQQEKEKEELESKIKELLKLQENTLQIASSKARLTATDSKKNFAALQKATRKLIDSKSSGQKIDTHKLTMTLWGRDNEK